MQKQAVHRMRPFIQMRFQLTEPHGLTLKNGGLIQKIKQSNPLKSTPTIPQEYKLKFCEPLSTYHFLMGNQYQLNLFNCSQIYPESANIASNWSISQPQKITALYVQKNLRKIFIVCSNILYCYGFREDSIQTPPVFYQKLTFKQAIDAIYIPKRDFLMVFTQTIFTVFQMYNPTGIFEFKKVVVQEYRQEHSLQFIEIPKESGFSFSLFFQITQEPKGSYFDMSGHRIQRLDDQVTLAVYQIRITFNRPKDIEVSKLEKMAEMPIPLQLKDTIKPKIFHFQDNIYLLEAGLDFFAFKHNYLMQELSFNSTKTNFLVALSHDTLMYYDKGYFDHYKIKLDENQKPEKFRMKCIDSIAVKPPQNSVFLKMSHNDSRVFIFYQENMPNFTNQLYFWIGISDCSTKQEKLKSLYPQKFYLNLQEDENEEDQQIVNMKFIKKQEEIECSIFQNIISACKIGFSKSQAYLQLWKRSSKKTKLQYEMLLIATQDYIMIKEEIINKLKVHSLSYNQFQFVLRNTLDMLKQKLNRKCSLEVVKQYAMCHFFCCKVEMIFKVRQSQLKESKIKVRRHESVQIQRLSPIVTISMQDFYYLNGIELESHLFQLLNLMLIDRKKVQVKIEGLLSQFSLIFRLKYHEILPKIIHNYMPYFLELITTIPEILPVQFDESNPHEIRNGIWSDIDLDTTQNFVISEHLCNIETRHFIQEFQQSKFFKVYNLNQHGVISEPVETIKKHLQKHDVNFVFTQLYSLLHLEKQKIRKKEEEQAEKMLFKQNIPKINESRMKQYQYLFKVIAQIQKYKLIPFRLKGKFQFYSNLYQHFNNYYNRSTKEFIQLTDFFSMNEDQLFNLYFTKERQEKGIFILKKIKPIYENSTPDGQNIFLRNMFQFFKSNSSSWSDLKIVLNKFNNQKAGFHKHNQQIFDVIVKAIMQKVYIKTDHPYHIKLDEVISYVQNIPIKAKDSQLLYNLMAMRQMNIQEQLLNKLDLNMNLREVKEKGEEVIFKMVEHQINHYKILQMDDIDKIHLYTYIVLVNVNKKQFKLYHDKHIKFPFKALLIILLQKEAFIPYCQKIITDQYLLSEFQVDLKLLENIMLYLYRKKLHKNPIYNQNKSYMQVLLEYLNIHTSNKAKFIVLSQAFAQIFTLDKFKIRYPFFMSYYPTTMEIQMIINSLTKEQVLAIDYDNVYKIAIALKTLGQTCENIRATKTNKDIYDKAARMTKFKQEVYIIFFIKMHKQGLFRQALHMARLIISIHLDKNISNIIFPILLIELLQQELLPRTKEPLLKLISYYFYFQTQLLDFIEELTNPDAKYSSEDIDRLIANKLQAKKGQLIINPKNKFFSDAFKKIIEGMDTQTQVKVINPLMETIWTQISQRREQFMSKSIYCIMFRLLLHDPFTLAEYIYRKHSGINVRSLRGLFTLLGFQSIFSMCQLLQVGEWIFTILMGKLLNRIGKPDVEIDDEFTQKYTEQYIEEQTKLTAQDLLASSIQIMKDKCENLLLHPEVQKSEEEKMVEIQNIIKYPDLYHKKKAQESHHLLQRMYPNHYSKNKKNQMLQLNLEIRFSSINSRSQQQFQYPFGDDDLLYTLAKYNLEMPYITYTPGVIDFDQIAERTEVHSQQLYAKAPIYHEQSSHQQAQPSSEFQKLFQRVLKDKAELYERDSIPISQERVWLRKKETQIDRDSVNQLFEEKCLEGGYLSMLKSPSIYSAKSNRLSQVAMEHSIILSESEQTVKEEHQKPLFKQFSQEDPQNNTGQFKFRQI